VVINSRTEADTERAGFILAQKLTGGDVVALRGGLGVGKTVFTRGLARGLGVNARVVSPTYNIVNEYEGRLPLFHFDMYRMGGGVRTEQELFDIGFDEYFERGGVVCIEWSELAEDALPSGAVRDSIEATSDDTRAITIEGISLDDAGV
jgi:tRNA threonylcarbamoyladenosine biosynthesis protein TsaE